MAFRHRQRGSITIEIGIAILVFGMLSSLGYIVYAEKSMARLYRAISEAQMIADYAEIYRRSVSATAPIGDDARAVHTYNSLAGVGVSVLNAALGASLPTVSPYGTSYIVTANNNRAIAQFTVPFQADPGIGDAVPIGGGSTRITLYANKGVKRPMTRAYYMKRLFHDEVSR